MEQKLKNQMLAEMNSEQKLDDCIKTKPIEREDKILQLQDSAHKKLFSVKIPEVCPDLQSTATQGFKEEENIEGSVDKPIIVNQVHHKIGQHRRLRTHTNEDFMAIFNE